MLQNQTYLGKTKYQKHGRRQDGSHKYDAPVEWFDGLHKAVIGAELFEECMRVRASRRQHRQATKRYNPYLLRDLVYCHRCCSNPPEGKTFRHYGKMRCQAQRSGKNLYYRCRAKDLGYQCDQKGVSVDVLDHQVVATLSSLKPPDDWRKGVTKAMGELLGEQSLEQRLGEIRSIVERMDKRWDNGFITDEQAYVDQRIKLQLELEELSPVRDDELHRAAEMLQDFRQHWQRLDGDPEAQHQLVELIVERVYVEDDKVVAMTLRSNYHLVLGHKANGPTYHEVDPLYTHGSDGNRALTCIPMVVKFLPWYVVGQRICGLQAYADILSKRKVRDQVNL